MIQIKLGDKFIADTKNRIISFKDTAGAVMFLHASDIRMPELINYKLVDEKGNFYPMCEECGDVNITNKIGDRELCFNCASVILA